MHISAKIDYAMRALLTVANGGDDPVSADAISREQGLSIKFLESILNDLRKSGFLQSRRGANGGYVLARPADSIFVADVFRQLDGPLAEVRGLRPETAKYEGAATNLGNVWVAVRASLRNVLETITLADLLGGELPTQIKELLDTPDAWVSR